MAVFYKPMITVSGAREVSEHPCYQSMKGREAGVGSTGKYGMTVTPNKTSKGSKEHPKQLIEIFGPSLQMLAGREMRKRPSWCPAWGGGLKGAIRLMRIETEPKETRSKTFEKVDSLTVELYQVYLRSRSMSRSMSTSTFKCFPDALPS